MPFDAALAARYAATALANIGTPYPYLLAPLLRSDADVLAPRVVHPAFHGSYDWHSCVHMHWSLVRLLALAPGHAECPASLALLDARLNPQTIAGELATFERAGASFERPYGWGWALALAAEVQRLAAATAPTTARWTAAPMTDPALHRAACGWRDALRPLADLLTDRLLAFLPRADFPSRSGAHANSAFALLLALDWSDALQHRPLAHAIEAAAHRWFGHDTHYPAAYEPSGDDFLSAGLVEAALMQRVLPDCDFDDWWQQFCPPADGLAHWLVAVPVSAPDDPKLVHLHGVNLTRAWCWQRLLPALPAPLRTPVQHAIAAQRAASLAAAVEGHYVGTHWLVSFALLATAQGAAAVD